MCANPAADRFGKESHILFDWVRCRTRPYISRGALELSGEGKRVTRIFGKRGPSLAANIPYGLISQWHRLARSIWISRAIYIFTYGARFVQIMLISSNLRRNAIDNYYSGLIESLHYRLERFAFRSKLT